MTHAMKLASILLVAPLLLLAACGSDPETSGSGGSGGSAGGNTGGAGGEGGGAGGTGNQFCPTETLGTALPITYDGSTVDKDNLVTSPRLEWTNAGDDALLFVAPEAAIYKVSLPVVEPGCGASVREYGIKMDGMGTIYDTSFCPPEGTSIEIDGVYIEPSGTEVPLPAGQEMLIWVSCASFSATKEAAYQLKIEKL
ncbi:MAG: hypothetical protein L6Q76_10930 [Polyangiaceae bacterium]|nr:hypothetical protein [Polyangiaceae bacterium]